MKRNGDEAKHRSSERDGGKDERKRKHRGSSQDRYVSLKDMSRQRSISFAFVNNVSDLLVSSEEKSLQ